MGKKSSNHSFGRFFLARRKKSLQMSIERSDADVEFMFNLAGSSDRNVIAASHVMCFISVGNVSYAKIDVGILRISNLSDSSVGCRWRSPFNSIAFACYFVFATIWFAVVALHASAIIQLQVTSIKSSIYRCRSSINSPISNRRRKWHRQRLDVK